MLGLWNKFLATALKDKEENAIEFCRHYLQYRFILNLAEGITQGVFTIDDLTDLENWERYLSRFCNTKHFEFDEILYFNIDVNKRFVMILYIFPKPRYVMEARYGAVVVNKKTHKTKYYTYEYEGENSWSIVEHHRYNTYKISVIKSCELKDFAKRILKKASVY